MNIEEVVEINPKKMSGAAVFRGTRVPITHLFEYLEGGETVMNSSINFLQLPALKCCESQNYLKSLFSPNMKLLLDECVTRYLKRDLAAHEVSSVEEVIFKGLESVDSALLCGNLCDLGG